MKTVNFEQFKAEVHKAVLTGNKNARIKYQSATLRYCETYKAWEIRENDLLHCEWGPAMIYSDGTQEWYYFDNLHRTNGPAVIYPDGRQEWYCMGRRHREDGPAQIYPDGRQEWWHIGVLHRIDGPARIYPDGRQKWYFMGCEVKENEPQMLMKEERDFCKYQTDICKNILIGNKERRIISNSVCAFGHEKNEHRWVIKCKSRWHCSWGPAVIYEDGTQMWYYMGELHREDGPAAIYCDGTQEWYYMGKRHRTDGPAVIHPDGTEEWWYMGQEIKIYRRL